MARRVRRFHNTFLTGQISQSLHERYDFEKREGALAEATNVRIRPQGGLVRRDGSRFVKLAKDSDDRVRLVPFVFSRTQAYVLEFGDLYIRFYRDEGRLEVAGVPVEVTTPWDIDAVQELDFSQDDDTMIITHPTRVPRVLRRWSDTEWTLSYINFRPPATLQPGREDASITLTFALIADNRYTVTASANMFTESDIGRVILEQGQDAQGIAVIDTVTSLTVCEVTMLETFSDLTLTDDPNGGSAWKLAGTPLANLAVRRTVDGEIGFGTKGELVTCMAYLRDLTGATNELSDGDFGALTAWDDHSGGLIYTGTHSGGATDNFIVDSANTNMKDEGVELNHLMLDGTLGTPGDNAYIARIDSSGTTGWDKLIPDSTNFAIANGNTFEVHDTGYVLLHADGVQLHAGPNGTAWLEQDFTANQQSVYEYEIIVRDFSCSIMAGTSSKGQDVFSEVTIEPGVTKAIFTTPNVDATDTFTLYFGIKNNQPDTVALIENIIVREIAVNSFGLNLAAGDWVRVNDGYIQVTDLDPVGFRFHGVIEDDLSTTEDALPGEWTIERTRWTTNQFPAYVAFYQGRLYLSYGLTAWGSVVDNINSFAKGVNDSDALEFTPAATQQNPVHWMVGERQLVMGTRNEEYIVTGTETSFIKPSDIDVQSPTAIGSEPVKPIRVDQSLIFVKAGGKRLIEYSFHPQGGLDQYRDLSVLVDDLVPLGDKIVQIAYQDEPYQTVWAVTENGLLLSMTYVKEHNVWAWAQHSSTDEATFESVAVIPHPDGDRDQVWLSVRRPWTTRAQISFLDDALGLAPGTTSTTMDGTARYTGASTTTITGLNHLTGATTVYVVDSVGIQGPYTVTAGQITIDRAVTNADVGVAFQVSIETLRPGIEGRGTTGLILGDTNMWARFRNTGDGITVRGKALKMRRPSDLMDSHITPVTGEKEIPSVGFDRDMTITIEQTIPAAFELQSIAGTLQYEDN